MAATYLGSSAVNLQVQFCNEVRKLQPSVAWLLQVVLVDGDFVLVANC